MAAALKHVVVFVQENHTTDNYFRSMRAWGANVASDWPTTPNPPATDQPHDRAAYAKWLRAQQSGTTTPAAHSQFDTDVVLPYYDASPPRVRFSRTTARGSARTRQRTTC